MTDPAFDKADQPISPARNADRDDDTIDFGFRTIQRADKARMVRGVFDSVADRYDIMNDVMSGGIHRLWKAAMIDWMAPQPHQKLIDLAGGTGDISLRFLRGGGGGACITDINHAMLEAGRGRRDLQRLAHRLSWCVANAESLPFDDHSADFVTIAFGLRMSLTGRPPCMKLTAFSNRADGFYALNFRMYKAALWQNYMTVFRLIFCP